MKILASQIVLHSITDIVKENGPFRPLSLVTIKINVRHEPFNKNKELHSGTNRVF